MEDTDIENVARQMAQDFNPSMTWDLAPGQDESNTLAWRHEQKSRFRKLARWGWRKSS